MLIADKLAPSTVAALGDQVEVRWVDVRTETSCWPRCPKRTRCWCDRPPRLTPRCWPPPPSSRSSRAPASGWTTSTWTPRRPAACWWSTPRRRTSTAPRSMRWRCCWPPHARFRRPTRRCASTPGSVRRFPVPRSSAKPSAWWVWAASGSWSPSGSLRSALTSSPMTRTFRRPVRRSWASNCCPWTTCWPAPISSRCTYRKHRRRRD